MIILVVWTILLVFISSNLDAQVSINIGIDPKISTIGTDNQYTKHDALFNYNIRVEYIDGRGTYFSLGHKYVNLSAKYNSFYFAGGDTWNLNSDVWTMIPQVEVGMIYKGDKIQYNHGVLYIQANLAMRYNILSWLSTELRGYVQLARDLPDRTFRFGSDVSLIITL